METPFFGQTCVFVSIVAALISEQTDVSNEAEVFVEVESNTGLETDRISNSCIALFAAGF
ncbi:MAG: hypothetical protein K2O12_00460 [Muribaculaceae bacterium]|nr:hypothetical protein [Muribaculaceae bacterium]